MSRVRGAAMVKGVGQGGKELGEAGQEGTGGCRRWEKGRGQPVAQKDAVAAISGGFNLGCAVGSY